MVELTWNDPGSRIYETGIDKGVLYPQSGSPGVAWNGLISVNEKPTSGGITPYYFDSVRFFLSASAADYEATIEAFTYPDEFEKYEGTATLDAGIQASEQEPVPFGLCYRTLIGNDTEGLDYGYKLHLVYNALTVPTQKDFNTSSDSPAASNFSWDIKTVPVDVPGALPSAHIIINSTEIDPGILDSLEAILYGRYAAPRLPLPSEILTLGNDVVEGTRFIIVIDEPDTGLLPPTALPGDAVISESDLELYGIDSSILSDDVRMVTVFTDGEELPDTLEPGDIAYNATSGFLYEVGA